jgi:hypothetical protein
METPIDSVRNDIDNIEFVRNVLCKWSPLTIMIALLLFLHY